MRILLSASAPYGERGAKVLPFSLTHIDLAVSAVIEQTLLRGDTLRFGGHPSISRLVLDVAGQLRRGCQIELYQSDFFAERFTREAVELVGRLGATLTRTPVVLADDEDQTRAASLALMRHAMVSTESEIIDAAFFVGGMSGIDEECAQLRATRPEASVFLLRHPGGQTRLIADSRSAGVSAESVLRGSAYPELVASALSSIGKRP